MEEEFFCKYCEKTLPKSSFHNDSRIENGVSIKCKECKKKQREFRIANPKEKASEGFKRCSNCTKILPNEEFHKSKYKKDGYTSSCRTCYKEKNIHKTENREQIVTEIRCNECNETKPIDYFYKRPSTDTGYFCKCIKCISEDRKSRTDFDEIESRQCAECGETKAIDDFHPKKANSCGHNTKCKDCCNKKRNKFYLTLSVEEKIVKKRKFNRYKQWTGCTICSHKRKGVLVTMERAKLVKKAEDTTHCEFCGRELRWKLDNTRNKVQPNSPTLENLFLKEELSELSDIAIVCHSCNARKGHTTLDEYVEYIKKLADLLPKINS